jgi:hypothetical protein
VCHPLNKPFDADANEARLGHCLMDLFSWRIHFEESESKEDVDLAEFLEWQFDLSDAVSSCVLVATDVSVPTEGKWQAALTAWLWHGRKFLQRTCCAAGRVTAPDAELYAIQIGLGLATAVPRAKSIKLFMDHFAVARKVVDPSIHAGQGHSLEVCCLLADWLGADPEQSVTFVKVLSHLEWGFVTYCNSDTPASVNHPPLVLLTSSVILQIAVTGLSLSTDVRHGRHQKSLLIVSRDL